jgi:hypothetical protein
MTNKMIELTTDEIADVLNSLANRRDMLADRATEHEGETRTRILAQADRLDRLVSKLDMARQQN